MTRIVGVPRLLAGGQPARHEGWRAEKRKPMVSAIGGSRRAPLGAPDAASLLLRRAALFGFPGSRSNRPPSSASSWQGLIMVPGGAPPPPECSCCVHEPAGAAPRPAYATPRESAPQRTRWAEFNAGWRRGDSFVRLVPIPAEVESGMRAVGAGSGPYSALQTGSRICLRRLLSNAASGTKRLRKLAWRAFFPAA
jgi:hypothetical protein